MSKATTQKLTIRILRKTDRTSIFIPPDADDICWQNGSETFTRKEVANLLWTQIAMINNDLRRNCGNDLTSDMYSVLENPRVPEF